MRSLPSFLEYLLGSMTSGPPVLPGGLDLDMLPGLLERDDPVILDVGCNDCSHTLEFLRLFKRAKVHAFEPEPRAMQSARHRVKDDRVSLYDVAISDVDGETEFFVSNGLPSAEWQQVRPNGWDLSGSIKKPKEHLVVHPWCTFDESIVVKTMKLDTWRRMQGLERIDFLWADVQGAEENLIRGGRETLRRTRYFYTEYSDQELYEGQIGLRKILWLLPGFKIVHRYAGDVLLVNKRWGRF